MTSQFTSGLLTHIADRADGAGTWFADRVNFSTGMVHAGIRPNATSGAVLSDITQSTTYIQRSIGEYLATGYSYSRSSNPTVTDLENRIAAAENAAGAACMGTGMAACCTIMSTFLSAGDHAIISNCSYGGTNRAARVFFTRFGIQFSFVDQRDLKALEAAIKPNTKFILTETPSNPTLFLADLSAVSALCKSNNLLHVCDTTLATPLICRAMDHGVDVLLISTTKYYDGHNMTVGGAVVCRTAELTQKVKFTQNILGNIMTPQVAYLQLQAAKTLPLRVRQQSESAMKIATFLETHPKVMRVIYPGLASHPQKELADKQHRGGLHGSMVSFEVHGGSAAGRKLMDSMQRPWYLAENLGSVESLVTCPSVMTHANMLKEDREAVGITDGLVRLSVGIEDCDDLLGALKKALDAI